MTAGPRVKPAMSAPRFIKRANTTVKDASSILKQGYAAVEQQRRQVGGEQESASDYAIGHTERTVKAAVRHMKASAVLGVRMIVRAVRNHRETAASNVPKTRRALQAAAAQPGAAGANSTAQAARKTVQKAQQATRQKQAAQRTAKATKETAKTIARAVKRVVKAVISFVRWMAGAVGVAATVIILVVIIGVVASIVASPFGVFLGGDGKTSEIVAIVAELNDELNDEIQAVQDDNDHVDSVVVEYIGSEDGAKINNWMDVLAVYAVRTTSDGENGMDVVEIDLTRKDLIREVYFDMNVIEWEVETEDGEEVLHIQVISKTAQEQGEDYGFIEQQMTLLDDLLNGKYSGQFYKLLGLGGTGMTSEELQDFLDSLPPGEQGSEAVAIALTRLGDPYSIPLAGTDNYTDCSHLVQWSYGNLGIDLPRRASVQAQVLFEADRAITKDELQPGDLIFWSYEKNGNFLNIGHVGIYAGDGKVIHASSVEMQVVIEPLFHADKQVMYGRV